MDDWPVFFAMVSNFVDTMWFQCSVLDVKMIGIQTNAGKRQK